MFFFFYFFFMRKNVLFPVIVTSFDRLNTAKIKNGDRDQGAVPACHF